MLLLYGLDLDTMKSSARGLIDKQQIISEEKSKYLVFDSIKGGYYLKEKYEQIFSEYYSSSIKHKSI